MRPCALARQGLRRMRRPRRWVPPGTPRASPSRLSRPSRGPVHGPQRGPRAPAGGDRGRRAGRGPVPQRPGQGAGHVEEHHAGAGPDHGRGRDAARHPARSPVHARHGADPAGRHRPQAAAARRAVPAAARAAGRPDEDDLPGGDLRRGLPGVHRAGRRAGQRPVPCPARPARGAARHGRGQGDPVDHGRAGGAGVCAPRPGCGRGPRTRSPTSTRCSRTSRWPAVTGSRSTTRRTPRGSSARARRSSGTTAPCAGAVSVTGIKRDLPAWRVDELGRTVRPAPTR